MGGKKNHPDTVLIEQATTYYKVKTGLDVLPILSGWTSSSNTDSKEVPHSRFSVFKTIHTNNVT